MRGGEINAGGRRISTNGIGVVVLMETKIVDNQYPKSAAGYTIMFSKAQTAPRERSRSNGKRKTSNLGQVGAIPWPVYPHVPAGDRGQVILRRRDVHPPPLHKGGGGSTASVRGMPGGLQTAPHGGSQCQRRVSL
jgi:hypothetical protein